MLNEINRRHCRYTIAVRYKDIMNLLSSMVLIYFHVPKDFHKTFRTKYQCEHWNIENNLFIFSVGTSDFVIIQNDARPRTISSASLFSIAVFFFIVYYRLKFSVFISENNNNNNTYKHEIIITIRLSTAMVFKWCTPFIRVIVGCELSSHKTPNKSRSFECN